MEYLLSVALFAVSSSVTPGPNNIMVMTSGLNFGVKRSLPLLTGICVGFTLMLLLVGLGFGELFSLFPQLSLAVKVMGTLYLLYLALQIAMADNVSAEKGRNRPLGFLNGALFQWVNAKAWVVAIGAISAFTTIGEGYMTQNLTIASMFFIASFPCVGVWLVFGSSLRRYLDKPAYLKAFNKLMALLLVVSVLPVVGEIIGQF
ncbi:LysE family translocator [Vibrio coralliilyticus]|uniref:Amino acid transporter LysE n=1 Tax=Vibrio coralliilyticus TaxID=190893 RepID=A0AAN0VYT6_9VIBR|nr:LysE family translocator [Vibrio coralliilyticus]AIW20900.1 amino acid transporter LysE [Vibrio coralliilyticus]NOH38904.1 LysE family translocator [Vibrio coralliilyticus]